MTQELDEPDAGARPLPDAKPSARSLLLTLLGEFVLPRNRPVWTAVLLEVLGGMGVAEKAARRAIERAAAAGWIESMREGRRTAWVLTDLGKAFIRQGSERLRALNSDTQQWDGEWTVLHVTVPEARAADRLRLNRSLTWIGFGNPTPGIWISPHRRRADEAKRVSSEMQLDQYTLAFSGRLLEFGIAMDDLVARAWDIDAVASHYQALVSQHGAARPRTAPAVLLEHIALVNSLQQLPAFDPGLPPQLLPARWNGRTHAAKLLALREQRRAAAHAEWDRRETAEGG